MSVEIANKTKQKINEILIRTVIERFLDLQGLKKDISVAIIGDKEMSRLNSQYRKIDKTTDILSFPDNDPDFLGELIISYTQLKKQAPIYSRSFDEELAFIIIHGLLHLIGFEDKTDNGMKIMEQKGLELMKKIYYPKS
jgi:probable rRNA maturation factor